MGNSIGKRAKVMTELIQGFRSCTKEDGKRSLGGFRRYHWAKGSDPIPLSGQSQFFPLQAISYLPPGEISEEGERVADNSGRIVGEQEEVFQSSEDSAKGPDYMINGEPKTGRPL